MSSNIYTSGTDIRTPLHPRMNERTTTTTTPSSSSSSSSSTSTTVQLRQKLEAEQTLRRLAVEDIKELYQDVIGRAMPAAIQRQLILAIDAGDPPAYYRYALEETAAAPMPSWRYVQAIVRRLLRDRVPVEDLLPY